MFNDESALGMPLYDKQWFSKQGAMTRDDESYPRNQSIGMGFLCMQASLPYARIYSTAS